MIFRTRSEHKLTGDGGFYCFLKECLKRAIPIIEDEKLDSNGAINGALFTNPRSHSGLR